MRYRHRHPVTRLPAKRGIATVETVLSLPFLLAAFSLIIAVAMASIRKSEVAIAARQHAWEERETGDGEKPFVMYNAATAGQRVAHESKQFKLPPPPVSTGQMVTAESRNQILTGSWNDPQAGLSGEKPDYVPHLKPLAAMVTQGLIDVEELSKKLANLTGEVDSTSGTAGNGMSNDIGGGYEGNATTSGFANDLQEVVAAGAQAAGKVATVASKIMNGALFGAGLIFKGLSVLTSVLDILSPLSVAADAIGVFDDAVDAIVPDFLLDAAGEALGKMGFGSVKEAKEGLEKASKAVKALLNMQDRISGLFEALYRASIGEDYQPDPAGFDIEELKALVAP